MFTMKTLKISQFEPSRLHFTARSLALGHIGVENIRDFIQTDSGLLRKKLGISAVKTQQELKGMNCLDLEDVIRESKSITSSRSFGKTVTDIDELKASITMHISKIATQMRAKKLVTRSLCVYAYTNRFSSENEQYHYGCTVSLSYTTNSNQPLLKIALAGIDSIYEKGLSYKKTGVLVPELFPEGLYENDLFSGSENPKFKKISSTIDQINLKFGRSKLFHGSLGTSIDWLPKTQLKSPNYTTSIDEVLRVK